MDLQHVICQGTPYEIGKCHGTHAAAQVEGSIDFYAGLFEASTGLEWPSVAAIAGEFEPVIKDNWPEYHEEMRGIADGAGVQLTDIVALNVRTEIKFGLFSDGCTSAAWKTSRTSFLGQNWDWYGKQKLNLISILIDRPGLPNISMITEAGIIGKIGLNDAGVGVCLNAIRARGLDKKKIPVHLALRKALDCTSAKSAVQELTKVGVASSAHILIADANESFGLECTSTTIRALPMDDRGRVFHTNHLIASHAGVDEPPWLQDSAPRLERVKKLANQIKDEPTVEDFSKLFTDVDGYPASICRSEGPVDKFETIFNIVMDLTTKTAMVLMGHPDAPEGQVFLPVHRN